MCAYVRACVRVSMCACVDRTEDANQGVHARCLHHPCVHVVSHRVNHHVHLKCLHSHTGQFCINRIFFQTLRRTVVTGLTYNLSDGVLSGGV